MKFHNYIFLVVFLLLGSLITSNARNYDIKDYLNPNNSDRKAYIQKYKDIAMREMVVNRIPASIKLAQGILESGDGKSSLANNANNHFGMKCGRDWSGNTYYLKDDDYNSNGDLIKSCFRVFDDPAASYAAHSDFLRNPAKDFRYGFLFDLDIKDYRAWAKGLKTSGYATNPRYAELLIGIIEANQLYQYDNNTRIPLDFPKIDILPPTKPTLVVATPPTNNTLDTGVKNEVVLNNGLRMVFASDGDTPRSLADFFGVKAKKIAKYNEFHESNRMPLKNGDRVYLQPKRKSWRGQEKTHKVKAGQNMFGIAQMYGVKIEKLYKRNRMSLGTEPAPGQSIFVRGKRKKKDLVKLRKKGQNMVPTSNVPVMPKPKPTIQLVDGKNVADVVSNKVRSFDLNGRVDAYAKITDGTYRPTVTTTQPTTTYPTTTQPTTTYPTTTQPTTTYPTTTQPTTTYPTTTQPNTTYPTTTQPSSSPTIVTYPTTTTPSHTGSSHPNPPTTTQPTYPSTPTVVTPAPTTPPRPAPAPTVSYHTVQGGETLYAISKKYNVSIGQIKIWNGLGSNLISIGQQLRVK